MIKELQPKFPHVKVNLKNTKGDKDDIIGYVSQKLCEAGVDLKDVNEYEVTCRAASYPGVLITTMNYVTLSGEDCDDSIEVIKCFTIAPIILALNRIVERGTMHADIEIVATLIGELYDNLKHDSVKIKHDVFNNNRV